VLTLPDTGNLDSSVNRYLLRKYLSASIRSQTNAVNCKRDAVVKSADAGCVAEIFSGNCARCVGRWYKEN
jgi:hypothetical protein